MTFGLKDKTIKKIRGVLSQYPEVEKTVLYGSRATGNFKNGSDIDLTFHGAGLTLSIVHKIDNDLDDLLLPYTFDLSIFGQIGDPGLIDHIKRVGVVFYETAPPPFRITREIAGALTAHALAEDPNECCGLLSGKGNVATEIHRITNLPSDDPAVRGLNVPADRTLRYVMAPKEQIAAFKRMRENGTELLAIYHSHTASPAYPSQTDIRLAFYPDVHYLIVSLENKNTPQVRAFRIVDKKITETKICLQ
ncbi:MAG: Mov34/MPN/PAD-1 family protein [Nitrospiria bacterium]